MVRLILALLLTWFAGSFVAFSQTFWFIVIFAAGLHLTLFHVLAKVETYRLRVIRQRMQRAERWGALGY